MASYVEAYEDKEETPFAGVETTSSQEWGRVKSSVQGRLLCT